MLSYPYVTMHLFMDNVNVLCYFGGLFSFDKSMSSKMNFWLSRAVFNSFLCLISSQNS